MQSPRNQSIMKYLSSIAVIAGTAAVTAISSCESSPEAGAQASVTGEVRLTEQKVAEQEVADMGILDFNEDVRPILSNTCYHCHGPDSNTRESGLALHTFEDATAELTENKGKFAIVPGKPEESRAIELVFASDESDLMPPVDSIHKLSEKEKHILKAWVKQGAHYEKHWAFIHPTKDIPKDQEQNPWVKNEIDVFVAAKHQELGIKHSAEATPARWLRRVTLSLTGVQPTPEEITSFLADTSQNAKETAVDRLLASPRYGEHMAMAWIEAARYADTDGFQKDLERQNWPWRDYVIKAFNEDKGFDKFTVEQLAGDMLDKPTHEQIIATAFSRHHRQNNEPGALEEEFFIENVLDRVDTVGSIYFGLTMSCARCHDHKYDPLSQKEVFQFSSYFNNIKEDAVARGVEAHPTALSQSLFIDQETKELVERRDSLKEKRKSLYQEQIKQLKITKPNLAKKALDKMAKKDPAIQELDKDISSLDHKLKNNPYGTSATVMIMKEAKGIEPTYLLERGQYQDPDKSEELTRTVPKALLGDQPSPKDRLELAQWIVSEHNPITARVIVNRMWMHHFGLGICSTPEDFGSQAAFPSHPKLLDWLAVDFRESGWKMKAMHKKIVLSATYGQSSKISPEQLESDSENIWLARGPRFRLSGYSIRDQALHASGLLHEQLGGPSVKPYQPDGLWSSMGNDPNNHYKASTGSNLYRRSLYTFWKRAVNPPRQLLFDGASREICTVTQNRTNTPLQALLLMNDKTFIEAARVLAERVIQDTSITPENRPEQVYLLAIGYQPDEKKKAVLKKSYRHFLAHYTKHPEEAEALVTIGSSPKKSDLKQHELAALTAVSHIIMNTDEIVTIE